MKSLNKFLIKAKVATYATSGEGGEKVLEDGAKELIFKKEGFIYRDRYYGHNPFIGEEIVWKRKKLVWGMNYYGMVLSDRFQPKKIYEFLKKALAKVDKNLPLRGPKEFSEGKFRYKNKVEGNIGYFQGVEVIYSGNKKIYELFYHGGLSKSKKT